MYVKRLFAKVNSMRKGASLGLTVDASKSIERLSGPATVRPEHFPSVELVDLCDKNLELGLINALNEYADSVNAIALEVRKEGDLLLTLGISDKEVMKAGALAQLALSSANLGRGLDLKGGRQEGNFYERKINVASGMAMAKEARQLLTNAKKHNKRVINEAIEEHRSVLASVNELNLLANV